MYYRDKVKINLYRCAIEENIQHTILGKETVSALVHVQILLPLFQLTVVGSVNLFPVNTDHTSPLSQSSVIVERSHVLTLLKVLNDLSTVHVDTGRAIAVHIALRTAGNSTASLNMSMKPNWFTWNPLLLHTWYHVFASSTKLSYRYIE